jgi:hypothetical protein
VFLGSRREVEAAIGYHQAHDATRAAVDQPGHVKAVTEA